MMNMVVVSVEGEVILHLYKKRERMNSNKIAKELKLNRVTVVHILERLEKRGLVRSVESTVIVGKIKRVVMEWKTSSSRIIITNPCTLRGLPYSDPQQPLTVYRTPPLTSRTTPRGLWIAPLFHWDSERFPSTKRE